MNRLKYYNELDGVRAIAALMVLFLHYFTGNPLHGNFLLDTFQKLIPFGQGGVTVFFVLSGFLITRILLSSKSESGYFKNFYARRVLRIFPLYFLFLVIFYVSYSFIRDGKPPSFSQQIWYWLYAQNIADTFRFSAVGPSHFWSLAIEEQFYLFWPLVILLTPDRNLLKMVLFVIAGATITRIIMVYQNYEVFYFTLTRMDELALGALVAVMEYRKYNYQKYKIPYLFGFVFFLLAMVILKLSFPDYGVEWIQVIKYPLMALFSLFFILYVISVGDDSIIKRFMNLRPMQHLGKISYGLYVYHPICFLLVNKYMGINNSIIHFFVSFAFAIVVSHLSYTYFERRFLSLKKYFDRNTTTPEPDTNRVQPIKISSTPVS